MAVFGGAAAAGRAAGAAVGAGAFFAVFNCIIQSNPDYGYNNNRNYYGGHYIFPFLLLGRKSRNINEAKTTTAVIVPIMSGFPLNSNPN